MRVVDVVLAFPPIVLAMAITAALGAGLRNAMLAILLVSWPEFSRLMRGQVLAIKENDYVIAARALGAPGVRVVLTHILPNAFPPIVVKGTLDIGNAIILTAALSFIGLGAVPPAPEWGAMIAAGQSKFEYWWAATFPGLAILSVVLGLQLPGGRAPGLAEPSPPEATEPPDGPTRGIASRQARRGAAAVLDAPPMRSVHSILDRICEFQRRVSTRSAPCSTSPSTTARASSPSRRWPAARGFPSATWSRSCCS